MMTHKPHEHPAPAAPPADARTQTAGQVLAVLVPTAGGGHYKLDEAVDNMAREAVRYADALLAVLAETPPP
jgi:hypothetical protein